MVRLTWHDNATLPLFEGRVLKEDYLTFKFHNKYWNDERGFQGKAEKQGENYFSRDELLKACQAERVGKDNVARYTSIMQRFSQVYGGGKVNNYQEKLTVLGMWIQEFAMNTIKHTTLGKVPVSEIFYAFYEEDAFDDALKSALEAFAEFAKEYDIKVSEDFAKELFLEVQAVLSTPRTAVIMAMSRNRSARVCMDASLRGVGLSIDLNSGSIMDHIMYRFLSK